MVLILILLWINVQYVLMAPSLIVFCKSVLVIFRKYVLMTILSIMKSKKGVKHVQLDNITLLHKRSVYLTTTSDIAQQISHITISDHLPVRLAQLEQYSTLIISDVTLLLLTIGIDYKFDVILCDIVNIFQYHYD